MFIAKNKSSGTTPRQAQQNLVTTTVRSFEGGLNVIDTDLNMSPKYAKILDNMERGIDGSLSLRPGTKLFTTLNTSGDTSVVVNITYFNNVVIGVQTGGSVTQTTGVGATTRMLIGAANPWPGGVTFVSFTIFNSQLIMCNGANKPLMIEGNPNKPNYMALEFLVDAASGSNINTPIGKYCCAHRQYLIIAGIPTAPSTIYISARGTAGTFPGDAAPNDAIAIDLGPRVSVGSSAITGVVAYRDKLLVTFERGVLPLNLGVYTGSPAVHTPSDDGFIEEFGCLSHRSLISVGDDTFYADNIGVNSIERIVLNNTLRPKRASQLVDPAITALIQPLTPAQINQYVFAVYDMRHSRYILFVPSFDANGSIIETIGFSYTNIPILKIDAWARLRGWTWTCACRTLLKNIIFGGGNKLYSYDFDNPSQNADFLSDTDVNSGSGVGIAFDWELPWADFGKRMEDKETKYLAMDVIGSGPFTLRAYVDNFYTYHGTDSPMLMTNFHGGNIGTGGYGNVPYGDAPFGGGRSAQEERLYAWTTKFKLMKLRFSGTSSLPLKFVSVSIAYVRKTIRR